MKLFFIRHGQSYVNLPDWEEVNQDMGLTDLGNRQAEAVATWLVEKMPAIDTIYASSMKRAAETAQHIATAYNNQDIIWDTRIREFGNNRHDHTPWESHDMPKYGTHWGRARPFASITPSVDNGESWMHFRTRTGSFIEDLRENHTDKNILIVCHGGVIDASFNHIFNIGPWRRAEVWTHNTGITNFEYIKAPKREFWRLHYQNRHEHLAHIK